jgi:hypothetical protein
MQIRSTASNRAPVSELPVCLDAQVPAFCSPFDRLPAPGSVAKSTAQFSTDLLIGVRPILSVKAELDELRSRCNQQDDLTTDIDYFLSCKHPRNCRPVVLILRKSSRPAAAVFLHEVCFLWLGTELCCGGDSAGDGLLIAPAEEREEVLKCTIDELVNIQKRFHAVRLRVKTASGAALVDYEASGLSSKLIERTVKHRLTLAGSYTDMLASFGLRTRRSLRAKRRRLEDALRPKFFSSLVPEQAFDAMCYLHSRSSPTRSIWHFESRRKFLEVCGDAFAMGLRSYDGTWLSVLSGWRRNGTTYVDMQLNHSAYRRESLSAVVRAFLLEHEIGTGQKYITFVGGCSALLERYCEPNETVVDLLVTRVSIGGWCLKKAIGSFCERSFSQWIYL